MSEIQLSILNLTPLVTAALAVYPAVLLADRWGRRTALLSISPVVIFSWVMMACWPDLVVFNLARLLQGVSVGFIYCLAPVYGAEVLDKDSRGRTGVYMTFNYQLGILFSYALGPILPLRIYSAVSAAPLLLYMVCFWFMPESPHFLARKGHKEEAKQALCWLRDGTVQGELAQVEEATAGDGGWRELFSKPRPLFVLCTMAAVKFLSGTTTVISYLHTTLGSMDLKNIYWASLGLEGGCTLSGLASYSVVDQWGRKPVLVSCLAVMTVSAGVVTVYSYMQVGGSQVWIKYVSLCLMLCSGHIGVVPVVDLVQAEYFPYHLRRKGVILLSFVTVCSTLSVFLAYPYLLDHVGTYAGFALFTGGALLGLVVFIPLMRETARVPLAKVQP